MFKTYFDAVTWLKSIGGKVQGPSPSTADSDEVVVSVLNLSRTGLIAKELQGPAREKEFHDLVRRLCEELHGLGAEKMVKNRRP